MLVEREIGDEPLQPIVFVLELPQAAQLTHTQVRVLFLPGVEGGFADPELAAHITDRCSGVGLAQRVGDCSSENFDRFIGPLPGVVDRRSRHLTLVLICRRFPGQRQRECTAR